MGGNAGDNVNAGVFNSNNDNGNANQNYGFRAVLVAQTILLFMLSNMVQGLYKVYNIETIILFTNK